ncbi:MAG: hypothetical protein HY725_13720 [Candidatus Rokubacteria bacterium]|nr:hypothetical protein [Candidatus Rokubacteria bacterium]
MAPSDASPYELAPAKPALESAWPVVAVEFLTTPAVPPAEALPELAGVPATSPPDLLIAHAATVKEWLAILDKLETMGIALRQAERDHPDPLVAVWIAEATENPEPLAPVADLMLLGGGWSLLRQLLHELEGCGRLGHAVSLERLAAIPGVYVPSLYAVEYAPEGPIARVMPRPGVPLPAGREGAAPFPLRTETGYRRYFVGEPNGRIERIAEAIKRERHEARVRLKREPPPVSVSLTCLVPWPWGPYQWAPMATEERLKDEIRRASRLLARVPGVMVTHDQPKWALLEGVLKMGDRRAGDLLLLTRRLGWNQARLASPLNPAFILHRQRPKSEILPWDHLGWGIDRGALWEEAEPLRAGAGQKS